MAHEEGDACPENCGGKLEYQKDGDCSCHISPPCDACTNSVLKCGSCGWTVPERPRVVWAPTEYDGLYIQVDRKPSRDLGNGKRLFDYQCDSSSGSTMVYRGRYEGDVTPEDIIYAFGDGSFGHRGPSLFEGRFTYTLVTD